MAERQFENSVWRILDAAVNRAGEGLRVVEDYVRMDLEDTFLAKQLKQLRHDLTVSVKSIDPVRRLEARNSIGDVGRTIETETEYSRVANPGQASPGDHPLGDLLRANMARAQQALRTVEEYSKRMDPAIARNVEQLRYRSYTIEKAVLTTFVSCQNMKDSKLYVLVDGCRAESNGDSGLIQLVELLVAGGVGVIQLRDKSLNDRQLVAAGRTIAGITRGTATHFIMNDRADLSVAANADGVHLGQDDLRVSDARRIVGGGKIVGVSTHSIEQARQAVLEGANYIGVGPVFPSQTKHFDSHVGLGLVAAVATEIQLPAFAIGGINPNNVVEVVRSGLSRVAVGAAITDSANPIDSLKELERARSEAMHVD